MPRPRLSWLVKLYGNLTYVRMRPAAIALNYSVKDIRHDVRQIIGASVSEPHTSESNWDFSYTRGMHCIVGGSMSEF